MEHTVTTKKWYVVTGTAGATVTSPDGSKIFCTVPEGGQGVFYATAPKVVTSDDSVEVIETTFNSAPVKLRILGLLGGGVSTGLPSGYLAAEFLESTGTQYIETGYTTADLYYSTLRATMANTSAAFQLSGARRAGGFSFYLGFGDETGRGEKRAWVIRFATNTQTSAVLETNKFYTIEVNDKTFVVNGKSYNLDAATSYDAVSKYADRFLIFARTDSNVLETLNPQKIKSFSATGKFDFIPCLDTQGHPCMFDREKKSAFYNAGTGNFVVGFTPQQALKLAKLPATGGTLTVSLPSNYAEDEGVVNALATAQENDWVITIQTYEAEAGAASTFARRRIWVRKRTDEQGSYVDTDGFRWQVEWCVDIVGADPEEEGYEPFRSVDVATEYWGLQPWVDPEAETELLTNTENE